MTDYVQVPREILEDLVCCAEEKLAYVLSAYGPKFRNKADELKKLIADAKAAPQQQAEPVAWMQSDHLNMLAQKHCGSDSMLARCSHRQLMPDYKALYSATPACTAQAPQQPSSEWNAAIEADQVEWVVNDIAELGVKIGNQFFWLYKGHSLVYGKDFDDVKDDIAQHDDGGNMHWRPVGKREFGECCHPINYTDPTKIGTVSLSDSDDWEPLPSALRRQPSEPDEARGTNPTLTESECALLGELTSRRDAINRQIAVLMSK